MTNITYAQDVHYMFNYSCADSSGGGYHGQGANLTYTQDIAGIANQAIACNANAWVTIPDTWIGSNQTIGFSVWFKTSGNAVGAGILYSGNAAIPNSPTNYTPMLWIDSAGLLSSYMNDGGSTVLTSTSFVNDDKWHHAIYYFSVTNVNQLEQVLWLDGSAVGVRNSTIATAPSTTKIYLGTSYAKNLSSMPDAWLYFKGALDEFIAQTGTMTVSDFHDLDLLVTEHPADATIEQGKSGSMHVSHTMFRGDSTYTYQWYKNGVPVSGATDSVLNLTSVSAADSGEYYCEIKNSNNYTVKSNAAKLTTTPASVSDVARNTIIQLYPNPAKNKLFIPVNTTDLHSIVIMSMDGKRLMQTETIPESGLDISQLPAGMYILKISGGENYFGRFTKAE